MIKRKKVIFSDLSLNFKDTLSYLCTAPIIGSLNIDASFNKFWSIGIFSSLTILLK